MRKTIAALLAAATLATPALAQRWNPGEGGFRPARERTVEQESGRARPAAQASSREVRQERRQDRQAFRQERREDWRDFNRERFQDRQALQSGAVTREQFRRDRAQDVRDYRRDRAEDRRDFRRDRAEDRRDWQRDRQDWQRDRNWNGNNRWQGHRDWNRDWRRDPRYNWQDWRQRNRGSYHFPRYYAPRGWGYGYRRFSFGAFLGAPFFAQDYWISDPFEYRLPPAYGPYRWVRYYDDVLLVDIRNGQVVDVIYDFFW